MSKYLIKILSICAFVIVLPLAILGTALCVTETRDYTLSLYMVGNESDGAASARLLIDGEEKEGNKVTVRKNTMVTIECDIQGYDFDAWYLGTAENHPNKLAGSDGKTQMQLKVISNIDLTAQLTQVDFTINVKFNSRSNETKELNLKDKKFTSNYQDTTPRPGYTFVGLQDQNGTLYKPNGENDYRSDNGQLLSDVVANGSERVISMTAVWAAKYDHINIRMALVLDSNLYGDNFVQGVKDGVRYDLNGNEAAPVYKSLYLFNDDSNEYDLNDNLIENLFVYDYYTLNGQIYTRGQNVKVANEMLITYGEENEHTLVDLATFKDDWTFETLIEKILQLSENDKTPEFIENNNFFIKFILKTI